ncbi:MAG: 5'-3' exonuclease H3TH domain-containing protein, partial [Nitriliruptoraceae bacterium]
SLLDEPDEAVTHLAVAFDHPIESFRNDLFGGYKDSSGVDDAVIAQFDLAEQAVASLGVTVWSMDTHEADDALASAAKHFADDVDQVRILTPDKDLGQVVRGKHVVQVDRAREREFDEDGVRDRLGVSPTSVPDLLALVGDTADGIPGLPGFGAKSAGLLLNRYLHLDAVPPDAGDWDIAVRGADRLASTLRDRLDDALLYRHLATLVDNLDLECRLADLRFDGTDRSTWQDFCAPLNFEGLIERPTTWR